MRNKDKSERINAKLAELFESDVKEFSENGAKAFGHILAKHGIDDPQKWFEEKMGWHTEIAKSLYRHLDTPKKAAFHNSDSDEIFFSSLSIASCKFVRAHEMVHKASSNVTKKTLTGGIFRDGNTGLKILSIEEKFDAERGKTYYVQQVKGCRLNEGVTNLIAQRLSQSSNFKIYKRYKLATLAARYLSSLVGIDIVFEATFFDPKILSKKLEEHPCGKYAYKAIVYALEILPEFSEKRLFLQCKIMNRKEAVKSRIEKILKKKIPINRGVADFTFSSEPPLELGYIPSQSLRPFLRKEGSSDFGNCKNEVKKTNKHKGELKDF